MAICPKKLKTCKSILIIKGGKNNYICSGISNTPTKYKKDIIHLCLRGILSKIKLEMTKDEASFIISVLAASLGESISNE
jgi:hypothetical protein